MSADVLWSWALAATISSVGWWKIWDSWCYGLRKLIDSEDKRTFTLEFFLRNLRWWINNNFGDLDCWSCCCCLIDDLDWDHFGFFYLDFDRANATSVPDPNIVTITILELPETHIASCCLFIIMPVGICRRKPSGTQIAEV
jgi:hypothetical protein